MKLEFNTSDPIFFLAEPTFDIAMSNNCAICEKDLSQRKERMHCQFCGSRACEKCMYKYRKLNGGDPNNKQMKLIQRDVEHKSVIGLSKASELSSNSTNKKGQASAFIGSFMHNSDHYGRCCKICDRKFLMRETYAEHQEQIITVSNELNELEEEAETKRQIYYQGKQDYQEKKDDIAAQDDQFRIDKHNYDLELAQLKDQNMKEVI